MIPNCRNSGKWVFVVSRKLRALSIGGRLPRTRANARSQFGTRAPTSDFTGLPVTDAPPHSFRAPRNLRKGGFVIIHKARRVKTERAERVLFVARERQGRQPFAFRVFDQGA